MGAILRSLCVAVGIPVLLACGYFGLIASDLFVSEARFAIRSAKAGAASGGLAAILSSPIVSSGSKEDLVVVDYARSQDMLESVQAELDLRSHYSASTIDALSRLAEDASQEALLEYFSKQVRLVSDSSSGVITLTARAFDPATAQRLAELVIDLSERLVNDMSSRMEEDALSTARAEVDRAAGKVRAASLSMAAFRDTNLSLNPAAESSALLGIVSGLESQLVELRAELTERLAYMRADAPVVISLKNRVNALQRQLKLEKGRIAGGKGSQMNGLIERYQPLVLEQEIAQQQYASALSSLELARIEAQRKKQYLVTFIRPNLPDEALEPQRLNRILTVMVFSFLIYLLGGLMWSALKDHIGR